MPDPAAASGLLDWALHYAGERWAVLPLHSRTSAGACSCGKADCPSPAKHPRVPNGLNDASSDPKDVRAWWGRWPAANVGVRTGAASGIVVVDVDSYRGGEDGLAELQQEHGPLPETLTANTGGGGRHLVYAHPGPGCEVRNKAGLAQGVDLRGDGGYIVAPPSVHVTGGMYAWVEPRAAIAPLPAWLREPRRDKPAERALPPISDASEHPWVKAAFEGELDELRRAQQGTRNHQLNQAAFNLGQLVPHALSRSDVEAALHTTAIGVGLTEAETRATIKSGIEAGMAQPRAIPERTLRVVGGKAAPKAIGAPDDEDGPPKRPRALLGGTFILDVPEGVPAIWREGERVLWAKGESFLLCGPSGVGKTTVAQQVVLARIGLREEILGLPVAPAEGRGLYLAMDRPAQVARSFRRMVQEEHRETLDERLVVWKGPPPFSVTKQPEELANMCAHFSASWVVIDSLKDLTASLDQDEPGSMVNAALQYCLAEGIDVLGLHHQRKQVSGGSKPTTLADVYGSTWLTAGAGSVLLLWGEPGDAVVEALHLKQPAEDVGPLKVLHHHGDGRSEIESEFDVLAFLRRRPQGGTVMDVAQALFGKNDPTRSQVEKARRRLENAVKRGAVFKSEGSHAGSGAETPSAYFIVDRWRDAE